MLNMKKYLGIIAIFTISIFFSGCSLGIGSGSTGSGIVVSSIMKTTDGGKTWEPKNKTADKVSLAMTDVLSIAINPYDGKNVFVGTAKHGILKTDDGGENWKLLGFPGEKVYGIAIDNLQGNTIYATGVWQDRGNIFKSIDGGTEWKEIYTAPSKGPLIISLAIDKIAPNILYASTSDNHILKSTDSGDSWQSVFSTNSPMTRIVLDGANNNLLYSITVSGNIFKSTDGGKSFVAIAKTIGAGSQVIEVDPVRANIVYVGGKNGIFKSINAGESWEEVKTLSDAKNFPVKVIAVNPVNADELMYGADQTVYRSLDGGKHWSPTRLESKKMINIIRYNPYESGVIYLGLKSN